MFLNIALLFALMFTVSAGLALAEDQTTPPVPEVTLKQAKQPPVLDGKLDDPCWQTDGVMLTGFTYNRLPVEQADPQTVVHMTYDQDNLYLGFEMMEPLIDNVVANVANRDGQVWQDDCIDFTVDTGCDGSAYYQFAINARGTLFDVRWGAASTDFNVTGYKAGYSRTSDRWIVEAAFPWKDFILSPGVGSTWRMNFCRTRVPGTGGTSSWSWLNGGFHNPARRGIIRGIDVDFSRFAAPQLRDRLQPVVEAAKAFDTSVKERQDVRTYLEGLTDLESEISSLGGSARDETFKPRWQDLLVRTVYARDKLSVLQRRFLDLQVRAAAAKKIGTSAVYGVCVASSETRTLRDQPFAGKFGVPAQIEMARNETESAHLVILPFAGELKNIKVSISSLTSGKHSLKADCVTINPLGYVKIKADDPKSYGDVMLPNQPFNIANGTNQSVLISIRTASDTPAGTYNGTVKIEPEKAHAYDIPIEVKVWDFALSNKPTLDCWAGATGDCVEWMNAHRMPNAISSVSLPADPSDFPKQKDAIGKAVQALLDKGSLSIQFWPPTFGTGADAIRWHGDGATAPYYYNEAQEKELTEWFKAFGQTVEELGVADKFWLWIWDEPSARHFDAMRQKCRIVRAGSEKIGRTQVGGGLPDSMVGDINKWIPLSAGHSDEFARAAKARGDKYWWYTCCEPQQPFANCAFVDAPLTQSRILPWMMYKYGVEGFLFWEFNYLIWHPEIPYAVNMPSTDCGTIGSGDGILWYKNMPNCRLNALADGFEDHQYLTILSRQADQMEKLVDSAKGDQKLHLTDQVKASRQLCELPKTIIEDLTHYAQTPDLMAEHRRKVAEQIVANQAVLGGK